MAGFLDASETPVSPYEGKRKWIVLGGVLVVVVGIALYFTFQNLPQERVVKQFFALLADKQYQDAYKLWGCTPEKPCKYYAQDRFLEDWGPNGMYRDATYAQVEYVDSCGDGVVFDVARPGKPEFGLNVDRATNTLGFAVEARCPGPHLHLMEFIKSRFGGSK